MTDWQKQSAPVPEQRFNRLHPQVPDSDGEIDFIYRIQQDGAFILAPGNGVIITSSITDNP